MDGIRYQTIGNEVCVSNMEDAGDMVINGDERQTDNFQNEEKLIVKLPPIDTNIRTRFFKNFHPVYCEKFSGIE